MAMIDYGAVVFKNGKQINHKFFEDMRESVGWSDKGRIYFEPTNGEAYDNANLDGNYFAYIGDEDFTVGFYKTYCRFTNINETNYVSGWLFVNKCGYVNKSLTFEYHGVKVHVKEITYGVYLASFTYKNDHYNVVYGYGIDTDWNTWNKIKVRYLGKAGARKVDNVFRRFELG